MSKVVGEDHVIAGRRNTDEKAEEEHYATKLVYLNMTSHTTSHLKALSVLQVLPLCAF